MTYRDVTLAPDDIEWDDKESEVKASLFVDEDFTDLVLEHTVEGALELVTAFHRKVANQLIAAAVDTCEGRWEVRTIALSRRAKKRRQELRRWYMARHGQRALQDEVFRLDAKYPRAEWGSALPATTKEKK